MGDELLDALAERLTEPVAQRVAELLAQRAGDAPHVGVGDERLLSCSEAAEHAGVHVETIRRAVRSGALPAASAGRAVRIAPADLAAWLGRDRRRIVAGSRSRPRTVARAASRRPLADALAHSDANMC